MYHEKLSGFNQRYIFIVSDYSCHLTKCLRGDKREVCGEFTKNHIWSYDAQIKRDYPSFGQIRAAINDNSK